MASTTQDGKIYGRLPLQETSIGTSSDKSIATSAFDFNISGGRYSKAAVETAFTATTHDITADKWRCYKLSIDTSGTITITPAAASGYDTEALSLAAIPSTPSSENAIAIVTVLTASGQIFDATSDALEGGSSGNPATTTNYYLPPFDSGQEIGNFSGSVDQSYAFDRVGSERTEGERFVKSLQHPRAIAAISVDRMVFNQSIISLLWNVTANATDMLSDLVTSGTSYTVTQSTKPAALEVLFKYTDTQTENVQEIFSRNSICEDLRLTFPKQEIVLNGVRWFLLGDDDDDVVKSTLEN